MLRTSAGRFLFCLRSGLRMSRLLYGPCAEQTLQHLAGSPLSTTSSSLPRLCRRIERRQRGLVLFADTRLLFVKTGVPLMERLLVLPDHKAV